MMQRATHRHVSVACRHLRARVLLAWPYLPHVQDAGDAPRILAGQDRGQSQPGSESDQRLDLNRLASAGGVGMRAAGSVPDRQGGGYGTVFKVSALPGSPFGGSVRCYMSFRAFGDSRSRRSSGPIANPCRKGLFVSSGNVLCPLVAPLQRPVVAAGAKALRREVSLGNSVSVAGGARFFCD